MIANQRLTRHTARRPGAIIGANMTERMSRAHGVTSAPRRSGGGRLGETLAAIAKTYGVAISMISRL